MDKNDYGKEFIIANLIGTWIFYGMEENKNNDYGKDKKEYPFRYYFYEKDNKEHSTKVDDLRNIIRLINNNKNTMSTLNKTIKRIFRHEPERTFVKVGFIDENEEITPKGLEALNYILWKENKVELKKIADILFKNEEQESLTK